MRTKKKHHHNKTKKRYSFQEIPQIIVLPPNKIQGVRSKYMRNGWICITIEGDPFPRGFAHGYLLSHELERVKRAFPFILQNSYKISIKKHLSYCRKHITPMIQKYSLEFYEELCGIVAGAKAKGVDMDLDFLVGWNSFLSIYSYESRNGRKKNVVERCSTFIACGDATEKGDIIMAHNTHTDFITGQISNIILDIRPTNGYRIRMQTSPGFIASGTDWFICESGIIGCESTIGDFNHEPVFGVPYYCRIRQAMQYGKTLDDYSSIMRKENAGDYASSWLFGDTKKKEIMLLELGYKIVNEQRKTNGLFYGMNSAISEELRETETNDHDFLDTATSSGARNVRLHFLLYETYYGKINVENAKKIISDHYDVLLGKEILNSRGICKHMEKDPDDIYLFGCTDGKVIDSVSAREMSFYGRMGSSCGRPFSVHSFIKEHPRFKSWKEYLHDMKRYPWTKI